MFVLLQREDDYGQYYDPQPRRRTETTAPYSSRRARLLHRGGSAEYSAYGLGPEGCPDLGFDTTDADVKEAGQLITEALTRLTQAGRWVGENPPRLRHPSQEEILQAGRAGAGEFGRWVAGDSGVVHHPRFGHVPGAGLVQQAAVVP